MIMIPLPMYLQCRSSWYALMATPEVPAEPFQEPENEMIVNRAFDVAQLGDGPWTSSGYGPDQFRMDFSGNAFSVERVPVPPGSGWPNGVTHVLRITRDTVAFAGHFSFVIEGCDTRAGQQTTISLHGRSSTSVIPAEVTWVQDFGTGSSDIDVTSSAVPVAFSTSISRESATLTPASVSGKDAESDHHARLTLTIADGDLGLGEYIEIGACQLDPGPSALSYRPTDPVREFLSSCRFLSTGNISIYPSAAQDQKEFRAKMRRAPTMLAITGGTVTSSIHGYDAITDRYFRYYANDGFVLDASYTADARF